MKWKHNFKHVDRSESLEGYIESRFEKMEHLILRDSQWQVFYSFDKNDCCVEISGGNGISHFKASAKGSDFYGAADSAADKLSRQFLKKKERVQHRKNFAHSKEGQLEHLNERLEYVPSPHPVKKPA